MPQNIQEPAIPFKFHFSQLLLSSGPYFETLKVFDSWGINFRNAENCKIVKLGNWFSLSSATEAEENIEWAV